MFAVQNNAVWRQTRILFLGSALLFLINIYYGFDNALTVGAIPHWQSLIHLHAGGLPKEQAIEAATFVTAAIEGGVMLSRVAHSGEPLRRVAQALTVYLNAREMLRPSGLSMAGDR